MGQQELGPWVVMYGFVRHEGAGDVRDWGQRWTNRGGEVLPREKLGTAGCCCVSDWGPVV
uniref:Uncharacterized protein n=1 Tax=Arundo donax TaxID=35708 RepID=A0A0A9CSC3_ARUDO